MTESASLQAVMGACLADYAEDHCLSSRQWQVCHHVLDCRTEALGGLVLKCDHCEAEVPGYYACRDRHCPRCQRRASEDWCAHQQAAVLLRLQRRVLLRREVACARSAPPGDVAAAKVCGFDVGQ